MKLNQYEGGNGTTETRSTQRETAEEEGVSRMEPQRREIRRDEKPESVVPAKVEPWGEAVDCRELLDQLEGLMKRFVVLPEFAAETLALWTLHTYAFQLREVSSYLGVESPERRCGKTTLLSLLSELANRVMAAANISSSAVFRAVDEGQPTLLIDETDTFLHRKTELQGILNAGYTRKTAYVVRVASSKLKPQRRDERRDPAGRTPEEEPSGSQLAKYSCWCPKAIATIGHLPPTLADRCIVIRMRRKNPEEVCERLRDFDGLGFRQKCARVVADNAEAIASARPGVPSGLNDRAAEIWEPLLVLADLAGGEWPEKARRAAVRMSNCELRTWSRPEIG